MIKFKYPKGSIWRKWDLQIQTIIDDGYIPIGSYAEELKTSRSAEWAEFIAVLGGEENAIKFDSKEYFYNEQVDKTERCTNYARTFFAFLDIFCPDLACVAVTDHNYDDSELLDALYMASKKANCKLIAGVEINCGGIHVLALFPGALYGKESMSESVKTFLTKCGIDNRMKNGTLTVITTDIKEVIDLICVEGGIVIFPHCNMPNGLFQERGRTDRTALSEVFNHQKTNLLQSQNKEACDKVSAYIPTNTKLASKFCAHISSDARSLRDYGKADKDGNYLWIKADPTFEGLRQILFESIQRVHVGPSEPEEKLPYFLINKVRFMDNVGTPRFSNESIEINRNLTTIIGGKSTGKSLLLYYIAKTIDPEEVVARETASGSLSSYDFDVSPDFNFEVEWFDGTKTFLRNQDPEADSGRRKILYIPQNYLNAISETNIQSKEALNKFVLDIILQDKEVSEKYRKLQAEIRSIQKSISVEMNEISSESSLIAQLQEDLKQSGDTKGIKAYVSELEKEVGQIKIKSGLTEVELEQYEQLSVKQNLLRTDQSRLSEDRVSVVGSAANIKKAAKDFTEVIDSQASYIVDEATRKAFSEAFPFKAGLNGGIDIAVTNVISAIDVKLIEVKKELSEIQAKLLPFVSKIALQTQLQTKLKALEAENKKLDAIALKNRSLETKQQASRERVEKVLSLYRTLSQRFDEMRNEFTRFEQKFGEISLSVKIAFNEMRFNEEVIKGYLNKHDLKRVTPDSEWGEEFFYKYDSTKHHHTVEAIVHGLLDGRINTVKNRSSKDAVLKLLDNYFNLDFHIFYKSDSLDKMSPGKKGLVLLQLLIGLSNEEWPILLDQPEDDLDNRSVYEDLVKFLRERKVKRQIIIVTHNPNLVVGADAEEVVVANQDGQETGRDNKKFRFEYVSGALENAFVDASESSILLAKGIRQHVCEILEGGPEAFQKREEKYQLPRS